MSTERFTGQLLRAAPHIAVLFYDAIGDFVVATPLLRGLREKYPGCTIDYFGGERSRQLEESCPYIDSRFSCFGGGRTLESLSDYVAGRRKAAGPYDLAINCDDHPFLSVVAALLHPSYAVGACYDRELRSLLPHAPGRVEQLYGEFWASPALLTDYADILRSQFIGEILCRLARVETDFARTEVAGEEPPFPTPPLLIATGGRRAAKLWPAGHWLDFIHRCLDKGLAVGLLGDTPDGQRKRYHSARDEDFLLRNSALIDLRGRLTLPQVVGALARARACVSIDNGIMHLAGAVGVPTVALFGASSHRVWAPPKPTVRVVLGTEPCALCQENRFRNGDCLRERQVCMESLRPAAVAQALDDLLAPDAEAPDSPPRVLK